MSTLTITNKKQYKFQVKGNITITPVVKPIMSGSSKWPIIERNGKKYLSKNFTFMVPKGIEYIKIIVPQYNGQPIAKFKMINVTNGKLWIYCADNASLISVVHVSHYNSSTEDTRVEYNLTLDDSYIEADPLKDTIEMKYSKEINTQYLNDNVTDIVEDILIKN
jgi:hypothetical protein